MTDDWPGLSDTGGRLPAYAERVATDDGDEVVRCTVCGNTAASLPDLEHDCIYQNDLVADGHGLSGTDHDLETHLDDDSGLWIPSPLRSFTAQVVFRTPRATIQHFQSDGGDLGPYYGMIDETHFGDPEDLYHCRNPELSPDQVSIKPQGEPAVIMPVATDPDPPLRTDGMGAEESTGDTERCFPGWYVIERPQQDPARVVAGPKPRDDAESHAGFLTDPNARVMHTPALIHAIKNDDYNVEWQPDVVKPASLSADHEQNIDHLRCTSCESNPTYALIAGEGHLVCHCTHVDGTLDPWPVHGFHGHPEPWEFVSEEDSGEAQPVDPATDDGGEADG